MIKDDNGDDRDNDPNDDKVMTEVVTEVTMMRKSSFASWWWLGVSGYSSERYYFHFDFNFWFWFLSFHHQQSTSSQ